MTRQQDTRTWYERYARRTGAARNDLRANPGVLFQTLAMEASLVRAARAMDQDPASARVLDVGCGGGGHLDQLVRLGYRAAHMTGVDILPERLAAAREAYPTARFIAADASQLDMPDGAFDLVFESTMFATLPDDALRVAIAREMTRVCCPGGYLLLIDWRIPKPGDPNYKALTHRELRKLFAVDCQTELVGMFHGALVPPLGRFLSAHIPSCYFLVATFLPVLVGQVVWLLRRLPVAASTSESDVTHEAHL